MPGSGFSDCDGSLDCGVKAAAERLSRFLDSVGVQSCDLLGSSYGGTTALMFAAMESTRVRTLTVVSPANPWSNIGRKRLALLNTPVIGTAFPPLARVFRPVHRYFVRRMYGDASLVTRETLKGYGRPLGRPGLFEHAVKIARAWRLSMSELEAALPALASTPVLLIWGSKDRLVEAASAERLKSHLPHSTLKVMMGSGHLPYEEHPEEFCRIVQEFLMKHQPSQGARQEVT
jgi:pimeloyl-ACP methyl ester carboxylesterase